MSYLITQIFILLLIAGLLGLALGWYLTRISATEARTKLLARLRDTEVDARALRAELDALATAKSSCDTERRLLSDELADLRAHQDVAMQTGPDHEALAALQAELDQCRDALVAAAVGVEHNAQEADSVAIASAAAVAASGAQGLMAGAGLPAPNKDEDSAVDDLRQIKGIGPKIAGILQELGIQRFEQIAAWSPENIDWVNERLRFKGRIEREEWIAQAKALIAARDT